MVAVRKETGELVVLVDADVVGLQENLLGVRGRTQEVRDGAALELPEFRLQHLSYLTAKMRFIFKWHSQL